MEIIMSGLDYSLASIELRENLSFTKARCGEIVCAIMKVHGVYGCVLLSTCNRTEIYINGSENIEPGRLLCQAAGVEYSPFEGAFVTRTGIDAVRHLMEVACGLRSQIWGEDQIISQVKDAITIAREGKCAAPVLEKLFQEAISAGKEVKTRILFSNVPVSAASRAVEALESQTRGLSGKKAMVIGNGEMGRLTARLLREAGCDVTVTLRTYKHGVTIVPAGCTAVVYEDRFNIMTKMDVLVSATTSPHYTVTVNQLQMLDQIPLYMVDLSIPRDIQPEVGDLPGVMLLNVDNLGSGGDERITPPEAEEIMAAHMDGFYQWLNFRDSLPAIEKVKMAITERVLGHEEVDMDMGVDEIVAMAVGRTVELMAGGLKDCVTYERLNRCSEKIRANTTKHAVVKAR